MTLPLSDTLARNAARAERGDTLFVLGGKLLLLLLLAIAVLIATVAMLASTHSTSAVRPPLDGSAWWSPFARSCCEGARTSSLRWP